MVLTAEEQAQLEALQAKEAEPAEPGPRKVVTIDADALEVVRQLVMVHWQSVAPEVASEINRAIADAVDEPGVEASPVPEPPAAEAAPDAVEPVPADSGAASPEAFGSESDPGQEPG